MKSKKGQNINSAILGLVVLSIGFIVVGLIMGIGTNLVKTQQDTFATTNCSQNSSGGTGGTILYTGCGYGFNSTVNTLTALSDTAKQQSTVGSVAILAIVIGMLLGVVALFSYMRGRGMQE